MTHRELNSYAELGNGETRASIAAERAHERFCNDVDRLVWDAVKRHDGDALSALTWLRFGTTGADDDVSADAQRVVRRTLNETQVDVWVTFLSPTLEPERTDLTTFIAALYTWRAEQPQPMGMAA